MRHLHTGRKLGVGPDRRRALLRSLTLALIEKETIRTTPAKAKELRWFADRVVTLAKRGDVAGRRQIVRLLGSSQTFKPGENRVRNAIERVYSDLVPRYKARNGGYTQIMRLALRRPGDNAEMCIMRYIPAVEDTGGKKGGGKDKGGKKAKAADKGGDKKVKAAAADKPAKKAKADKPAQDKAPQDKPAKSKKEE